VHYWLVANDSQGQVFLWRVTEDKIDLESVLFYEGHSNTEIVCLCSYDEDRICGVYSNGLIVFWELPSGKGRWQNFLAICLTN
jgi:hypothetical protein